MQTPVLKRTLKAHDAGINTLALTASGQYLLSGGMLSLLVSYIGITIQQTTDDKAVLCLWSLQTGKLLQKIDLALRGPISASTWLEPDGSDVADQFAIGFADGSIIVYQRNGDLASTSTLLFQILTNVVPISGRI
jgi:WD40 repeat protein